MEVHLKIPFYAKIALISICLFALIFFMSIGQHILIPIIYASMAAILLDPIVNFLIGKGLNKIISIFLVVVMTSLITLAVIYFISSQVAIFSETYPQLRDKFNTINHQFLIGFQRNLKFLKQKLILKCKPCKTKQYEI